jgi:guanylate kinase
MKNNKLIFVICGPSGAGKTTLKSSIVCQYSDIRLCPSITTRPKKISFHNIQEYYYICEDQYHELHDNGELISRPIRQFGFFYGIRFSNIIDILDQGYHVLLETTLWGIEQLKKYFNEVVSIFIAPPSITELRRRIKERGRDSSQEIDLRFNLAKKILSEFKENMVDYYLINYNIEESIKAIYSIINQEKLKWIQESTKF